MKCRGFKRMRVLSRAVSERIKLRQDAGLLLDAFLDMTWPKKRKNDSIHDIFAEHFKLVGEVG
jgi:hypothetical protein